MKIIPVQILCFSVLTLAFVVASLSTSHWVEIEGGTSYSGLFFFCLNGTCDGDDGRLQIVYKGIVQTTAAYMVMGLITLLIAAILWVMEIREEKGNRLISGTFFTTLTTLFLLVACCVFAEVAAFGQTFGYSYGFAWAAFVFSFISFLTSLYAAIQANKGNCCDCAPPGSSTI